MKERLDWLDPNEGYRMYNRIRFMKWLSKHKNEKTLSYDAINERDRLKDCAELETQAEKRQGFDKLKTQNNL